MENESQRKPRVQFGVRTLLEIITVAAFLLALIYLRDEQSRGSGRYQMGVVHGPNVFAMDTKTGRVLAFDITNPSLGWIERAPVIPPTD